MNFFFFQTPPFSHDLSSSFSFLFFLVLLLLSFSIYLSLSLPFPPLLFLDLFSPQHGDSLARQHRAPVASGRYAGHTPLPATGFRPGLFPVGEGRRGGVEKEEMFMFAFLLPSVPRKESGDKKERKMIHNQRKKREKNRKIKAASLCRR